MSKSFGFGRTNAFLFKRAQWVCKVNFALVTSSFIPSRVQISHFLPPWQDVKRVMSNSFGFGGTNTRLFKRAQWVCIINYVLVTSTFRYVL